MHNFDFKKGVWGRKYESSCFTTSTAAGNTFFQIWNKRLLQDGYEMKGDEEIIMITTFIGYNEDGFFMFLDEEGTVRYYDAEGTEVVYIEE